MRWNGCPSMGDVCPNAMDSLLDGGKIVGVDVFVKLNAVGHLVTCQQVQDPLLLDRVEQSLAILVAVVGAFAAEIIGQCYSYVVPCIAALQLFIDACEATRHPHLLEFTEIVALTVLPGIGQDARPLGLITRSAHASLIAQAVGCLWAVGLVADGPP